MAVSKGETSLLRRMGIPLGQARAFSVRPPQNYPWQQSFSHAPISQVEDLGVPRSVSRPWIEPGSHDLDAHVLTTSARHQDDAGWGEAENDAQQIIPISDGGSSRHDSVPVSSEEFQGARPSAVQLEIPSSGLGGDFQLSAPKGSDESRQFSKIGSRADRGSRAGGSVAEVPRRGFATRRSLLGRVGIPWEFFPTSESRSEVLGVQ